jgi:hypothetical protein
MEGKPVSDRLATTSLVLGILGWVLYLLQWCFDLTLGLVLVAATGGGSAICSSALDVLPFLLWLAGIISGHASFSRRKDTVASSKARAIWGLVLSYLGIFFTLLLVILIIILVVSGIHAGWLDKIFPFLHK